MRNFNKRRFIISPLKGISTMLTEPFSICSILEYTKKTSRNRVMSLLRKSEMSSVSSKAKEAISCHPLRVGGGEGMKRRITFQTMVEHAPLVAGIQFPTQPCLSHDHWFINGCSHYCRSSSSADFTQSLLFSFSLRKTPRGYLKKIIQGRLI